MKPIVSCVWVKGNVPYTAEYVLKLRSMVRRNLLREHDFVCLTDQPEELRGSGVDTEKIPTPPKNVFGWWAKLWNFSSSINALQNRRCMAIDLDVAILKPLDTVLDYPSSFALIADDAPNFLGKGSRRTVKRFNSSVMVWNGGQRNYLFDTYDVSVTERLWGDQDWIGERAPDADTMPLSWFPRMSQCGNVKPDNAVVLLCKKPKPHLAASIYPWFKEAWV